MKSLCSMVNDMNEGVLGVDTYGHFNSREDSTVLMADDAEWGDTADDAEELGEVFGGVDTEDTATLHRHTHSS
jgi:hypothetical protein